MRNKVNYAKWIFVLMTLVWLGMIFSFSLEQAEESTETSMKVVKKVIEIVSPELSKDIDKMPANKMKLLHEFIRKCAHYTEFMILGILSGLSVWQMKWKQKILIPAGFCVMSAMADETIQLFVSGRNAALKDVLLDSLGAVTGILLLHLCFYLFYRRRKV